MTPKQIERLKKKIADIKRALAAEKRKFGWYDDGRGLRYLPTKYFIQLGDYSGGLTYTKWFDKNFPDDSGFPDFLFEWTIILFKTGRIKEAEQKAFQTFCRNTYLFDKFFGRPIIPFDKWEGSNLEAPGFTEYLDYSCRQPALGDFSEWLASFISTQDFINRSNKYIDIQKRLKTEDDSETRHYLVRQANQLEQSG
ncbi:hypothetical protein OCK74_10645 [Chitinophagaceae bacterium LB-8]|uniref:Uncharacterized protein n=1 Tax=Paraflavisolibacter caeni TaxID=2982496 RepID=A0A9X3B7Q8_9BACT|nr:hypothetical protein [Paraflavisolibacter caeni]MCU7549575.1 hypothetical protein [Paraflavisolibacter caeni]